MNQCPHFPDDSQAVLRRTILVVEDSVLVREVIAGSLRDDGFKVIEAASADEAVVVLQSGETIDFVFSDCEMPGTLNGPMLAAWLHKHQPRIPVMLTSGNGAPTHISQSVSQSNLFIPKPYSTETVLTFIRSLLEID
jgi:CheY-like chemotaxis protein